MKNKNAFSMVEISIVMVILGILTVLTTYTIQERFRDYYSRYSAAYDALSKAAYNTYVDTYCRTDYKTSDNKTDCIREEGEGTSSEDFIKTGRPFPKKPVDLCKRLTEYLNKTEDSECKEAFITDADDDNFKDETLQFSLSNGYRFYFSALQTKKIKLKHPGPGKDDEATTKTEWFEYFIVYVDLNGKASPNTAIMKNIRGNYAVKPDIVPFIVTTTGDVIPVGDPVFDKTYVSARIYSSEGEPTKSFTLDEARQLAYGNYAYTDIPWTLIPDFNKLLPNKVRPIGEHTKFEEDKDSYVGIDDQTAEMNCRAGTFNCQLKIDENVEKRY